MLTLPKEETIELHLEGRSGSWDRRRTPVLWGNSGNREKVIDAGEEGKADEGTWYEGGLKTRERPDPVRLQSL